MKHCKTKEDVQKLKMNRVSASLSAVNHIKNNPNIPEGAKLGFMVQIQHEMKAIEETTDKFIKSDKYSAIPTEAEKAKADKILSDAEKEKLNPDKKTTEEVSSEFIKDTAEVAKKFESISEITKSEHTVTEIEGAEKIKPESSPKVKKVKKAENGYIDNFTSNNKIESSSQLFETKI
ncbi:MAG: hypothetical protein ACI4KH_08185 [Oscillospiraceae bacterium]